jgi:3-(3-hydroxy-phenyl)propionate hydroxylase
MTPTFDVAIVGFGPTGAVAAALLGQAGLRVHVCDLRDSVYDKPRAVALDHEILRVFDQIGVLEQVEPWLEPFTDSEYVGVDGQLIKCMTTVAPPYPMAYPPSVVFSQPPVEQVLRDRVASLPNVEVALGSEVVGLVQDGDFVTLRLRQGTPGRDDATTSAVTARHVIGCDGASSRVRGLVGIELEDLGFDEPWLVIDVLANARGLARLPKVSMQYCEPDRPCSYVIGPKNHRRWEISLKDDEDPQEMATREGAWRALERWINPEHGEIWRQASYRFHALVATRWRAGRIFVAGDAAHQQPPFLGQGLCQGVRDVANLCWKLVAVHERRARDALLDSYGAERKRHVQQLTARIKGIGAVICERDPARARARDAALLADCAGVVRAEPRQNVQPRLEGALPGFDPLAADAGDAAVGTLFPQPWIVQGSTLVRLDRLSGSGWRVVTDDARMAQAVPGAIEGQLRSRTVEVGDGVAALHESDGVVARWFRRHDCRAAIVRPDHYVHAVAATPAELGQRLRDLVDRFAAPTPDFAGAL